MIFTLKSKIFGQNSKGFDRILASEWAQWTTKQPRESKDRGPRASGESRAKSAQSREKPSKIPYFTQKSKGFWVKTRQRSEQDCARETTQSPSKMRRRPLQEALRNLGKIPEKPILPKKIERFVKNRSIFETEIFIRGFKKAKVAERVRFPIRKKRFQIGGESPQTPGFWSEISQLFDKLPKIQIADSGNLVLTILSFLTQILAKIAIFGVKTDRVETQNPEQRRSVRISNLKTSRKRRFLDENGQFSWKSAL